MNQAIERDVEAELKTLRKPKRVGERVVYPLEYTKEIVDFDNWDFFFMKSCCRSLTMNQVETPPRNVLDIACGSGLWIIEAAQEWKDTTFTGFDYLKTLQPKLEVLPEDIRGRVEWIHGSFLEPLPFPSNHFDMIRSVRISFHMPETEGQDLMDEILRMLKPGGFYEAIEEDLVFPHSYSDPSGQSFYDSASGLVQDLSGLTFADGSPSSPYDTVVGSISQLSLGGHSTKSNSSGTSTRSSVKSSGPHSPTSQHSIQSSLKTFSAAISPTPQLDTQLDPPPMRFSENKPRPDPRDHTKLKDAWDLMLRKRSLAPQITSVLPMYLPMTFAHVRALPPLRVPLPPESITHSRAESTIPEEEYDSEEDAYRITGQQSPTSENLQPSSANAIKSWGPMHLARVVCNIRGCKEAIWEAYRELFQGQFSPPPVVRSARKKDIDSGSSTDAMRDIFEIAWSNWESDMKDRIGIRGSISAQLLWGPPPEDPPDWRVRQNVNSPGKRDADQDTLLDEDDGALCRALRGFVCWKSTEAGAEKSSTSR